MGVKTIEAEYTVHATQYWEVEHIEGWPRDSHGPLSIDTAEHFYIKWGLLHVQWEKDGKFEEYEPTAEISAELRHGLQVAGRRVHRWREDRLVQYEVTIVATNTVLISAETEDDAVEQALALGVFETLDGADYDVTNVVPRWLKKEMEDG